MHSKCVRKFKLTDSKLDAATKMLEGHVESLWISTPTAREWLQWKMTFPDLDPSVQPDTRRSYFNFRPDQFGKNCSAYAYICPSTSADKYKDKDPTTCPDHNDNSVVTFNIYWTSRLVYSIQFTSPTRSEILVKSLRKLPSIVSDAGLDWRLIQQNPKLFLAEISDIQNKFISKKATNKKRKIDAK